MKGKYYTGSKITWKAYAAFIRSRKEQKSTCSQTVINI